VFIFVPYSHYDEPKTLSYFMQPVCLLNADGGQARGHSLKSASLRSKAGDKSG
jgi:hypothetical protein